MLSKITAEYQKVDHRFKPNRIIPDLLTFYSAAVGNKLLRCLQSQNIQ